MLNRSPLNWISNPALDAPIVAGCWWLLFAMTFDEVVEWKILLALVPAVWVIYLFDRLYDARIHKGGPPQRKQFAKTHRSLLKGLLMVALCWAGAFGLAIPKDIWTQIVVIGLVTLGYFVVCRWKSSSTRLPVKEAAIGGCFAAGVGIPFRLPINWLEIGSLAVFGILCTMNCLIISRAETEFDRNTDPSAWFATGTRTFPFTFVLGVTGLLTIVLAVFGLPVVLAAALLLANGLLFSVMSRQQRYHTQPLSDAALWVAGLVGVLAIGL